MVVVSSHVDETSQEESFDHLVRDSFNSDLTVSLNEDHLFAEILTRKETKRAKSPVPRVPLLPVKFHQPTRHVQIPAMEGNTNHLPKLSPRSIFQSP